MSLTKVNYIDNSTIITAKNLNDIQDNIIELNNSTIITAENLNDIQDNIIKLNNNSISKDNIINNFTTTEEGFVADARALKLLNDSKMSMELLWENETLNAFPAQSIPIDFSAYNMICIEHFGLSDEVSFNHFIRKNIKSHLCCTYNAFFIRKVIFDSNGITFGDCGRTTSYYGWDLETINTVCIPHRIYGIKGVN